MAKLIYSVIASLDGYVADENGTFDWAAPDEEVHAFVNELERPVGTYLYGRRMYETMVFWERPPDLAGQPPFVQDFAEIWQSADKIVYSKTLQTVTSAKTVIARDFDPEAVRHRGPNPIRNDRGDAAVARLYGKRALARQRMVAVGEQSVTRRNGLLPHSTSAR